MPPPVQGGSLANLYLFCLLVGGFFVGAAALHGQDTEADHGAEGDHDLGDPLDLHIDVAAGAAEGAAGSLALDMDSELAALPDLSGLQAEHAADLLAPEAGETSGGFMEAGGAEAVWMPVLSLRFLTYGSCFFGLTGLVLGATGLAGPGLTLGLASGMGFACGYAASWLFRRLRSDRGARAMGSQHTVGVLGTVLVPVGTARPGKVRCRLRGQDFDLIATSMDKGDLDRGTRVLVVGFEDDAAQVVHAGRLLLDDGEDD